MADIGRFNRIDPFSEMSPFSTPYAYAENEPVNSNDMGGNFRISAEVRTKYPKVTAFLEKTLSLLQFNTSIVNSIANNTGLDKSSIRKDLVNGSGPIIETSRKYLVNGYDFSETKYGEHKYKLDKNGNKIAGPDNDLALNSQSILQEFENALATNSGELDSRAFFTIITILHEYTHNALARSGIFSKDEIGWHWEGATFRRTFDFPTDKMASEYGQQNTRNTAQSYLRDSDMNSWLFLGMGAGNTGGVSNKKKGRDDDYEAAKRRGGIK
jgi:hypothetical protein